MILHEHVIRPQAQDTHEYRQWTLNISKLVYVISTCNCSRDSVTIKNTNVCKIVSS